MILEIKRRNYVSAMCVVDHNILKRLLRCLQLAPIALLVLPGPSAALDPPAPVSASPSPEDEAGAATLASNREAMARAVTDTAAIAAYQQQLALYHEQQAQYLEQQARYRAQLEQVTAANKAAQDRYVAARGAADAKPDRSSPPANGAAANDEVSCRNIMVVGSRIGHRECHTRREWKRLE